MYISGSVLSRDALIYRSMKSRTLSGSKVSSCSLMVTAKYLFTFSMAALLFLISYKIQKIIILSTPIAFGFKKCFVIFVRYIITSCPPGKFLVKGKKFSFANGAFRRKMDSRTSVNSLNLSSEYWNLKETFSKYPYSINYSIT